MLRRHFGNVGRHRHFRADAQVDDIIPLFCPALVELLIIGRGRRACRGELSGLLIILEQVGRVYVNAVQTGLVAKVYRQGDGLYTVPGQYLLVQVAGAVGNDLYSITHHKNSFTNLTALFNQKYYNIFITKIQLPYAF